MSTYHGVNTHLALCLNRFLNVKAVAAAFNQENALVRAFSVIVKTNRLFASLGIMLAHLVTASCRLVSNMKAWVPSATFTGPSSRALQSSKHGASGPCGVIMECSVAPPGQNPSSLASYLFRIINWRNM